MIFSPQFVRGLTRNIFPELRKTQTVNLGLAVYGQILSQSTVLSQIVRQTPGAVKHKHRLKRLWRFVSNPRVKPERLFEYWIPWCTRVFGKSRYVPVALDWTGLPGNHMCLVASLVLFGRAIPLLWQVVKYSEIKDSTNRIEQRLVTRLINLAPAGKKLVILADRGFGRTEFLRFLLTKPVSFSVRVDKKVRVQPLGKRAFLLSTLAKKLRPEIPAWFSVVAYRDDGAIPRISLAAIVAKDSSDPWFLATNLKSPSSAMSYYAARFQIEAGFKDLKHALGLEKLQTRNLTRIRRILLITSISQAMVMLIGKMSWRFKTIKQQLITGGKTAVTPNFLVQGQSQSSGTIMAFFF